MSFPHFLTTCYKKANQNKRAAPHSEAVGNQQLPDMQERKGLNDY
jgi:hypothetical protein